MFSKKNVRDIPIAETPPIIGCRKLLATSVDAFSPYLETFTYEYLPPQQKWSMHQREDAAEILVIVKGTGVIRDANGGEEAFGVGDRFIFPPSTLHEIENNTSTTVEFYFIRVKTK